MFEPRKLRVIYSIRMPDASRVDFDIQLDECGLLTGLPDHGPEWTRMNGKRCAGCSARHQACRAAVAIAPVVTAFKTLNSLDHVDVRVVMADYTAEVRCPVSKVVSSVMGLRMAASGCARIAPFRAMALYHQPFSSLEDTVIRAAGFMLLRHWAHDTLDTNDPFGPLIDAWEGLEEVNLRVAQALQDYGATDAALNGLVNLDMFAKAGGLGLKRALDALKPALLAWDVALDSPAVVAEPG